MTGVVWQQGTMTYQAGASGSQGADRVPLIPPATPPSMPGGYSAMPSSPLNAGAGNGQPQPPTYPPTVAATPPPAPPEPAVSGPVGQPEPWTNPLQPPYAVGQPAPVPFGQPMPFGQAAPTTGSPFTPGQTTYQTPGYPGPYATPSDFTPTYQSPVPVGQPQRPRGRLVAIISAICIIAILGTGAVFAYNFLSAHTENGAAKLLPANTYYYSAVDLVSLANNTHHVTLNDLLNPTGSSSGSSQDAFHAVGLSFQTDIQPWLNRVVAIAAFAKDANAITTNSPTGRIGGAILIQSRDDGAAQAAMTKAANYLRSIGSNVITSTYSNIQLYTVQTGDPSGTAVTFGAGKGWAIVALDSASAHMIIDRINSAGDTLAGSQDFQSATSNLPSNRFGTLYVNLKALVNATSPSTSASVPFLNMYPVATGYTSWTDAGLRAAVTLHGNANIDDLGGDTKSLAGIVPAGVLGYVGVANLGGLYQAATHLAGTSSDPAQSDFGVAASNPALQQPAAYAYLGSSGDQSQALFLHLSSDSVGQQLIHGVASAHSWTSHTTTMSGQSVTVFYDQNPGNFLGNEYGYGGANGPYAAGYAAIVHGTLVVTAKDTAMQAVIGAAQGSPSLAQDATFSQLVGAAPSDAAVTGYVNLSGVTSAFGSSSGSVASRVTALLVTGIWNDSELQVTFDTKMNG